MKKILSVFLGLATILSLGFTSAFADPSAAEPDIGTDADEEVTAQKIVSASSVSREEKLYFPNGIGDIPVPITEEQQIADAMEQNLSSTQILQIQQKLNNVIPSDYVDLRTTLKYLTGSAPTPQAAAAGIGIVVGAGSNMYLGITYYDAPITAGIVVNNLNEEWPYTTTRHATVVRGIRSDNQLVQLADPGVKYWNSTLNSYFMVSSDELYKAVSYSSKCGYIY